MFMHWQLPDDHNGRTLAAANLAEQLRLLLLHLIRSETGPYAEAYIKAAATLSTVRDELHAAALDQQTPI